MKCLSDARLALVTAVLAGALCLRPLNAQQKIPLQNQDAAGAAEAAREHLEVEVIEIGPQSAIPTEIHRPVGKFILLLVDRTRDRDAAFVLEPEAASDGVASVNPVLRLTDRAPSLRHKVAGLVDLPAGRFDLKAAATGEVLCHITIE